MYVIIKYHQVKIRRLMSKLKLWLLKSIVLYCFSRWVFTRNQNQNGINNRFYWIRESTRWWITITQTFYKMDGRQSRFDSDRFWPSCIFYVWYCHAGKPTIYFLVKCLVFKHYIQPFDFFFNLTRIFYWLGKKLVPTHVFSFTRKAWSKGTKDTGESTRMEFSPNWERK